MGLVIGIQQIRQRLRITLRARRLCTTERFQGFGGHHPWRNASDKAFGQERPQRLVFPRLNVTRRPVVEQAETGNVFARLADRDGIAHVVTLADPDAQLQFIVQTDAGAKHRFGLPGGQGLAFRTAHVDARRANGRGTAVVADWYVLVVGQ